MLSMKIKLTGRLAGQNIKLIFVFLCGFDDLDCMNPQSPRSTSYGSVKNKCFAIFVFDVKKGASTISLYVISLNS